MKTLLLAGLSVMALTGINGTLIPAMNATEVISAPIVQAKAQSNVLASGQFVTVEQDHATKGTARIVEEEGQRYLEFDDAFDTARGPAVQVVLHKGNTVPVKLAEENYTYIGDLQSFEGKQRYAIPASLNLDDYESVAIWCEEFNVTFGYADL